MFFCGSPADLSDKGLVKSGALRKKSGAEQRMALEFSSGFLPCAC